jgi:ribosomal protein L20A (L18A)
MYKEFRELTRADAVKSLYQDMAARHRARFRSIHVCNVFIGGGPTYLGTDHVSLM